MNKSLDDGIIKLIWFIDNLILPKTFGHNFIIIECLNNTWYIFLLKKDNPQLFSPPKTLSIQKMFILSPSVASSNFQFFHFTILRPFIPFISMLQ